MHVRVGAMRLGRDSCTLRLGRDSCTSESATLGATSESATLGAMRLSRSSLQAPCAHSLGVCRSARPLARADWRAAGAATAWFHPREGSHWWSRAREGLSRVSCAPSRVPSTQTRSPDADHHRRATASRAVCRQRHSQPRMRRRCTTEATHGMTQAPPFPRPLARSLALPSVRPSVGPSVRPPAPRCSAPAHR